MQQPVAAAWAGVEPASAAARGGGGAAAAARRRRRQQVGSARTHLFGVPISMLLLHLGGN